MTDETATTIDPTNVELKRWPKHAVWVGLIISIFGTLSYFLYFAQFPILRDFPVLNLPIVLLGVILAAAGCWQLFRQGGGMLSKGLAGIGFLLTLGFAGLFNAYIFSLSYQLPESLGATATQTAAPDFTLLDHNNQSVTLSDYQGEKVVLVFYRGFW